MNSINFTVGVILLMGVGIVVADRPVDKPKCVVLYRREGRIRPVVQKWDRTLQAQAFESQRDKQDESFQRYFRMAIGAAAFAATTYALQRTFGKKQDQ